MNISNLNSTNVVKKIIAEIISRCAQKGVSVAEELAIYILKVVLVHPDNGFDVSVVQSKSEVERIIWSCVERIRHRTPCLDTLKMQVYFSLNYATREEFILEHTQALNCRLKPLINKILNSKPRLKDDYNELYQQIVLSIMLWAGLTATNDMAAVKETTTALQSVFPRTELGSFLALDAKNKERQMEELRYIVTGICLYNGKCGKGGKGIEYLPNVLKRLIPQFNCVLAEELKKYQKLARLSLAILDNIPFANFDYGEKDLIAEAETNARQAEFYIKIIQQDVYNSSKVVEMLEKSFEEKIEELHTTVRSRVAIPTGHVYPLFIHVAHSWKSLQNENVLLCLLRNIVYNLNTYTEGSKAMMESNMVEKYASKVTVKTEEELWAEAKADSEFELPFGKHLETTILSPDEIAKLEDVKLEYEGFCPWSLTKKQLLVHGNDKEIVLYYNTKYFTFLSKEGALNFAEDPEWFITHIKGMATYLPDLIQLLQIQTQIYPQKRKEMVTLSSSPLTLDKRELEVQTEVHPVEQNIDPNYEWNEWQLRRKAIELANLRKKTTHSSQTEESHLRRENCSQVYLPKNQECQTVKNTASNTQSEGHFLAGLRGYRYGRVANFQYLDLTEEK